MRTDGTLVKEGGLNKTHTQSMQPLKATTSHRIMQEQRTVQTLGNSQNFKKATKRSHT